MEPQSKESSEPWMVALLTMVAGNLTLSTEMWFFWIRALSTEEFKRMLIRILATLGNLSRTTEDTMLDLLGTTAGTMSVTEMQAWSAPILLARNRLLATRKPIPDLPSPDTRQE